MNLRCSQYNTCYNCTGLHLAHLSTLTKIKRQKIAALGVNQFHVQGLGLGIQEKIVFNSLLTVIVIDT